MTATVNQGQIVLGISETGNPRIAQGVILAAVSFLPPNSPPQINQGALIMAARKYPVVRTVDIGPAVDLPCIASCGSVPHFWRQS